MPLAAMKCKMAAEKTAVLPDRQNFFLHINKHLNCLKGVQVIMIIAAVEQKSREHFLVILTYQRASEQPVG
jgi:hypothetical protein